MAKTLDLGAAPSKKTTAITSVNTTKKDNSQVDLNFKVDAEFRKDFKLFAVSHEMSQKEVLERAFELLKQSVI